ncbi:myo-inosose-2 dehydratase [Pantoea sp. T14]|jgi:inosose dehydratase|uniref:myo-inosose-2 dehydratase n=1 Tax=Pantoea sp. T14 TaxID=3085685 RepID=UPI002FC80E4E
MILKAKLGIAPIAWSNDDLPQLGGDTPLSTCLAESREAGFSGVETGGKFPLSSAELRPQLAEYDLQLVSGWYSGTLLDNDLESEIAKVTPQLQLFKDCGAACLVYGETAGTIQNRQDVPLSQRRRLTESEIQRYGEKLTAFSDYCAEFGVPLAFHHHMGTAIEDERDIDLLMAHTGPSVGLLFDTGHLVFAGADPFSILKKHANRINHVHTKDVRAEVLAALDWQRDSFLDAVLKGVYTVPGDGCINFDRVVSELAETGYQGWFVVEAEQDPALAPPLEYARIGYASLIKALAQANYVLTEGEDE